MPDRYGRKPLGAVNRHPADWFSDYLYFAGFVDLTPFVGPGELYSTIALFNNDDSGRLMVVYGCTAFSEGGGGAQLFGIQGSFGAPVANARSIRVDQGAPAGIIFQSSLQVAIGVNNPFIPALGDPVGHIAAGGFDSQTVMSPFPIAKIPNGYSLLATNPQSSQPFGAGFYFQMSAR